MLDMNFVRDMTQKGKRKSAASSTDHLVPQKTPVNGFFYQITAFA